MNLVFEQAAKAIIETATLVESLEGWTVPASSSLKVDGTTVSVELWDGDKSYIRLLADPFPQYTGLYLVQLSFNDSILSVSQADAFSSPRWKVEGSKASTETYSKTLRDAFDTVIERYQKIQETLEALRVLSRERIRLIRHI